MIGGTDGAGAGGEDKNARAIRELGIFARRGKLPWLLTQDSRRFCPTPWEEGSDVDNEPVELDDDQRLGLFAVAATLCEKPAGGSMRADVGKQMFEARSSIWREMALLLFPEDAPEHDEAATPVFSIAEGDLGLVESWRRGELRFVESAPDGADAEGPSN